MIEDCWRKINTYFHFALHFQPGAKPTVIYICCAKVSLWDFHQENLMNSVKKACPHHPTLFKWASEVWRAESRSLLANWIAPNSLLPVFLLSLTFTELQLKLLVHYHSDCVSTYWQSLTLFIISLILSWRPCVVSSCPYLWCYLYHLPLVLPSHSFLELILSSGPSGLYHPPAFAQLSHFLSPWQTSLSMFCKNQSYSWRASESQLLLQYKILLNLQVRRKQSTGVVEKMKERGDEKWKLIVWNNPCFVAATRKWQQQ